MAPERTHNRHFTRIPFDARVHVTNAEGSSWHCDLIDISLKGALTTRPHNWAAKLGAPFRITLHLANSDVDIHMEVSVAHSENNHVGFRCEHVDLDSITHLRRLVELNLGDDAILARELADLSAKHKA
jgi:hypothetical protein